MGLLVLRVEKATVNTPDGDEVWRTFASASAVVTGFKCWVTGGRAILKRFGNADGLVRL